MKITHTCTGQPREHSFLGKTIKTSMLRSPQPFIQIQKSGVIGDQFLSPNLHGLQESAVYMYSASRFTDWQKAIGRPIEPGQFGENLTVDDFDEKEVFIGDLFSIGTTRLIARGCRFPCARLNFVFQRADMEKLFRDHNYPGIYFEVETVGQVRPGDEVILDSRAQNKLSIYHLYQTLREAKEKVAIENRKHLKDLLDCKELPEATKKLLIRN